MMKALFFLSYLILQTTIIYATNQYLGCFIDQIGNRDLNIFIGDDEQLTPKQCIFVCSEQNYLYAAIQYGTECRCGNHYGQYGQVSDDECSYRCSTSEKCGGNKRNSVYHVMMNSLKNLDTTCQNNLIGYQGCFDSQTLKIGMDVVDSIEECIQRCAKMYNYAGIINGNLCYCGNDLNNHPSANTKLCNISCRKNADDKNLNCCGGLDVFSIYNTKNYQSPMQNDFIQTIIRVKRADAAMDSTQTSLHVTDTSSIATMLTSTLLNNPSSLTVTNFTSQPISTISSTVSSLHTDMTSSSSISQSVSYMTSVIPISSIGSTLVASDTSATSTSSMVTNTVTITSSLHTDTSYSTSFGTISSTYPHMDTSVSTYAASSISFSNSIISSTSLHTDTLLSSISSTGNSPSMTSGISFPSTMISTPITSPLVPTDSTYLSQTSSNLGSFSTLISTESYSTLSSTTASPQSNSGASISISFASSTTNVNVQTTFTSSGITNQTTIVPITTSNSSLSTTISTTVSTTRTTTTVPLSYVISTVFLVPLNQTFDPNNNNTLESLRQNLKQIINLAFNCLINSAYPNCTQPRQRIKRQICSNGYDINFISNLTEISNSSSRKFMTDYVVRDLCNSNALILPSQVKLATDTLSRARITNILGYQYDGDLVRSTSITGTDNPTSDPKLWLIGAVLGPVAFAVLLIFIFCYLHYKCRPRPTNQPFSKALQNPPLSARSTNNQPLSNDFINSNPPIEKHIHIITQNDPLVGVGATFHPITPTESEEGSNPVSPHPISTDMSMDEIRRQNDVERWRNKLRLQEKFQQSPNGVQGGSVPNTNRSGPHSYNNRSFDPDRSNISASSADAVVSVHSSRRSPQPSDVENGRTKLHRLLDEVLDKADSQEGYNPDSDVERQKRRRQRRRIHSTSDEPNILPLANQPQQIPHIPVIPQVSQRPDPSLLRLRYNPYEAGDRAHEISRFKPVELTPKYETDDQHHTQYSSRSNPPLFYDDSTIPDRASTATDAYASPKRSAKTRVETDREAVMRHQGGHIDRREHRFHNDAVYVNSISKHPYPPRSAWVEPETNDDLIRRNDYRDEYIMAKRSVLNTKNIISSIHDELQQIVFPRSGEYYA